MAIGWVKWFRWRRDEKKKETLEATARPRLKRRTWGTLRVFLNSECAKASSSDGREFERFWICHPGPPACANQPIRASALRVINRPVFLCSQDGSKGKASKVKHDCQEICN